MSKRKPKSRLLKYGSMALAVGTLATGAGSTARNVKASQVGGPSARQQAKTQRTNINRKAENDLNKARTNDKATEQGRNLASYPSVQNYAGNKSGLTLKLLAQTESYTIQEGDTAKTIASSHSISVNALESDNPGVDFNHLIVGKNLRVPKKGPQIDFNFVGHRVFLSPIKSAENQASQKLNQSITRQDVDNSINSSQASVQSNQIPTVGQPNANHNQSSSSANGERLAGQSAELERTPQSNQQTERSQSSGIPFMKKPVQGWTNSNSAGHAVNRPQTLYQTHQQSEPQHEYGQTNNNYPVHRVTGQANDYQPAQRTNNATRSTNGLSSAELAARNWISTRESGNNYNARNGNMIGKYQLTSSLLHGDYSPANQDRTANNYARARYGGWVPAKSFWQAHHWY